MARSTALHISYTVRAATHTAVSASISTPVGPDVSHVAKISKLREGLSGLNSRATWERFSGWQSGMSAAVLLAAMIPATLAAPNTSPFSILFCRALSNASAFMEILAWATATRREIFFEETLTICARPLRSTCVSLDDGVFTFYFSNKYCSFSCSFTRARLMRERTVPTGNRV